MRYVKTVTVNIGLIPAILILIFACGVSWWASILIALLAASYIKFERS